MPPATPADVLAERRRLILSGDIDGFADLFAPAVPDGDALRAWADHLTEIGVAHNGIVLENGNPSLSLRDPDGIAIELVAPGGRTR